MPYSGTPAVQRRKLRKYRRAHPEVARRAQKGTRTRFHAWINEMKGSPCVDCGHQFPPECMDFDHVRGRKLFAIATAKGRARRTVLKEIEKCDLVCANCHRIRTVRRRRAK